MNEGAQAKAIQDIVQKVQPGDTLYIDLSGGMRDTAMLLVAVARYLRDIRDVTAHVLYTELVEGKPLLVRDSDKLYDLFDLISATDEFFATGRTGRLSGYLRVSAVSSPKTATLLNSIEKFSEDLLLCNAARLLDDISALKAALTDVLKDTNVTRNKLDTLLYDLLNDGFKKEFRNLDKKKARALPTLVRWCLNHDMFQQAFTLLSEQTPAFVCSHIFVQPTQKGVDFLASQLQNKGKNWSYPLFHFHFCRTALMAAEIKKNNKPGLIFDSDLRLDRTASNADDTTFFRIATDDELNRYLDRSVQEGLLLLDESQRGRLIETILGYQKVQQYRNQINHAQRYRRPVAFDGARCTRHAGGDLHRAGCHHRSETQQQRCAPPFSDRKTQLRSGSITSASLFTKKQTLPGLLFSIPNNRYNHSMEPHLKLHDFRDIMSSWHNIIFISTVFRLVFCAGCTKSKVAS